MFFMYSQLKFHGQENEEKKKLIRPKYIGDRAYLREHRVKIILIITVIIMTIFFFSEFGFKMTFSSSFYSITTEQQ